MMEKAHRGKVYFEDKLARGAEGLDEQSKGERRQSGLAVSPYPRLGIK